MTTEFLFDRESWLARISDLVREPARGNRDAVLGVRGLPYRFTRRERHVGSMQAPSGITVSCGPNNSVVVVGRQESHWRALFVAEAAAQSGHDAQELLDRIALSVSGNALSLSDGYDDDGRHVTGELVLEVPGSGEITVQTSYSPVVVLDVAGAVRVASAHARSTILNTSGEVEVSATCIDFAGASGHVNLNAIANIDLKITAGSFDGLLVAVAGGSLRLLVPPGFQSPLRVTVPQKEAFLCRTEFASDFHRTRDGDAHTFSWGSDAASIHGLHLRASDAVVMDA